MKRFRRGCTTQMIFDEGGNQPEFILELSAEGSHKI